MLAAHHLGIRPWEWPLLNIRDATTVIYQCQQIRAEQS